VIADDVRGHEERPTVLDDRSSVEAERLDAIGGVAAGVAHHLNNILMVALGNIQLALMHGVAERPASRLHSAERAVRDAAEVLRSLTSFCRTQPMSALAPLDLNLIVDDVVELSSPQWRDEPLARGVRIHVRIDRGELVPVVGSGAALRQVFMNLVLNAVEAMPAGGVLTLRTWADDGSVRCAVSDTGVGMSEDVRRRALEPFHTTKGPKTRGLGLAVAHGIVTRHGGTLAIDSVAGLGTSVVVALPAAGSRPLI
jgi:signal transduction histidine kinase